MSRTIQEIRVKGRKQKEVKEHIAHWLAENYFAVKEWSFKRKRLPVFAWHSLGFVLLSPHTGSIVAVRMDLSGCIVFEIILKEENNDTLVHGEFYAAGGLILLGREWDLRRKSPAAARWPREGGYVLMSEFLESLESLSAKPEL